MCTIFQENYKTQLITVMPIGPISQKPLQSTSGCFSQSFPLCFPSSKTYSGLKFIMENVIMYTRNFEVRYLIITVPYLVRAFKSNRDKNCRVMGGSCHFYIVFLSVYLEPFESTKFSHFKREQFVKMLSKFDTTRNKYPPSSEIFPLFC